MFKCQIKSLTELSIVNCQKGDGRAATKCAPPHKIKAQKGRFHGFFIPAFYKALADYSKKLEVILIDVCFGVVFYCGGWHQTSAYSANGLCT